MYFISYPQRKQGRHKVGCGIFIRTNYLEIMIHKTVREIAAAWKKHKRPYVKQSTMAAYVLILENHVLPYFGDGDSLHEQEVQTFAMQRYNKHFVSLFSFVMLLFSFGKT